MDEKELLIDKKFSWRAIKYILGTIFLGALGSGLWDLFLSELLYKCASIFANIFASFFSSYVEILHKNIGQGLNEESSMILLSIFLATIMLIGIFLFLYIFNSYRHLKKSLIGSNKKLDAPKIDSQTRLKRFKKKIIFYFFAIIPLIFMYAMIFFTIDYQHRAIVFIERSIEIVTPNITTNDLVVLRSKYRSINSAKEFYELETELRNISLKYHIKLPEFSTIKP